ncbi:MAG: hypothetical protein P8J37_11420 [Fuerstiella sp.]|nr:hypothetical protein [Fuerstiella sp.]
MLARANKKVLMDAIGRYGVSNERLDEVSDYYRYNRSAGEVWKHSPPTTTATVRDGRVTGFDITDPGNGYLVPTSVSVVGFSDIDVEAKIEFSDDFRTNGRIVSITVR